jgi:hypothetical protein
VDPLLQAIPGLREAVEKETAAREEAFLDAPEFICGVEVMPLTMEHMARLSAAQSPFICGGVPLADDCALFLWCISRDYERAIWLRDKLEAVSSKLASLALWVARRRFVARLRHVDSQIAIYAINAYCDSALMDAPRGADGASGPSYWSCLAALVFSLAQATGWGESEIVRMPCKRLFQYMKLARKYRDPDAILFNPSDRVVSKWLEEVNSKGKANGC